MLKTKTPNGEHFVLLLILQNGVLNNSSLQKSYVSGSRHCHNEEDVKFL